MPKSSPQPSFSLHKLRELQIRLDRDKDLGKFWNFYMDRFADHPEFLDFGGPVDDPFLKEIIPLLSQKLFNKEPHDILLIKIPEYDFIHGSFWVEKQIGGVIYFEKKFKGVAAIEDCNLSGNVKYSRFTGYPVDNN
ncbi:hypothetical protein [Laspinema olomoucense]|uniref:hypothetical protein n=1 Tax=Laspinema olomoucense TaxID=3231600 RepID=UPI0021BAE14D|nr:MULTISPECIES: hypothetical protein [unclassified Laspinema]MCT7971895.1 hypothetical protein [Laspinema sp. D3d]MCT7991862.1 hypothetical protein [Laspinema sp. D3a]